MSEASDIETFNIGSGVIARIVNEVPDSALPADFAPPSPREQMRMIAMATLNHQVLSTFCELRNRRIELSRAVAEATHELSTFDRCVQGQSK